MPEFPVVDLSDEPSPIKAVALFVAALNNQGARQIPQSLIREADKYLDYLRED